MTTDPGAVDELLLEARAQRPALGPDLMARVLDDADVALAARAAARVMPFPRDRRSAGLRGWPVAGGLLAAGVAGLWIGAAAPEALGDLAPSLWSPDPVVALGVYDDPLTALEDS